MFEHQHYLCHGERGHTYNHRHSYSSCWQNILQIIIVHLGQFTHHVYQVQVVSLALKITLTKASSILWLFYLSIKVLIHSLYPVNPLCTSRLNLYDDIEEFTVKLFSVQFSSGFFSRKALDLCFYMQKTEVFYLV